MEFMEVLCRAVRVCLHVHQRPLQCFTRACLGAACLNIFSLCKRLWYTKLESF